MGGLPGLSAHPHFFWTSQLTVTPFCAATTLPRCLCPPRPTPQCSISYSPRAGLWLTLHQYAQLKAVLPQLDGLVADAVRTIPGGVPPFVDNGGAAGRYASHRGGGAPPDPPGPIAGGSSTTAMRSDGGGGTADGDGGVRSSGRRGDDMPPF